MCNALRQALTPGRYRFQSATRKGNSRRRLVASARTAKSDAPIHAQKRGNCAGNAILHLLALTHPVAAESESEELRARAFEAARRGAAHAVGLALACYIRVSRQSRSKFEKLELGTLLPRSLAGWLAGCLAAWLAGWLACLLDLSAEPAGWAVSLTVRSASTACGPI